MAVRAAKAMLAGGVRARITCCDPRVVDASLAAREWDRGLLASLPEGVDPCGENGEFHTFCYAGPMFRREIGVVAGEGVERDGFCYADFRSLLRSFPTPRRQKLFHLMQQHCVCLITLPTI